MKKQKQFEMWYFIIPSTIFGMISKYNVLDSMNGDQIVISRIYQKFSD